MWPSLGLIGFKRVVPPNDPDRAAQGSTGRACGPGLGRNRYRVEKEMADDVQQASAVVPPGALIYPLGAAPEADGAVEIAPGLLWMRMPLGGAMVGGTLSFINVWAIAEDDGWVIIDTGLHTDETFRAWRDVFAGVLHGRPVKRVIVTHLHPDHVGMAGWITRKFGCRLWMTRLEFFQCRMLVADTGREAPPVGVDFYRATGWDEDSLEAYRNRFGLFGKAVYQLPDSYRRISDGEELTIGDHVWRVVVGAGHSPEHACLYCPALKLLISGDQVLPRITSNVSVFPTEPDGDPLSDWLTSLARVKTLVPDEVLVLPAHNEPFIGLHARIDTLIAGHEHSLVKLEACLAEPKRVLDVFPALFRRPIKADSLIMATGESLAHLNCLIQRGRAELSYDADGVAWYVATASAEAA